MTKRTTCPRCGKPVVFIGGNKRIMADPQEKFLRMDGGRKKAVTVDGREVRGSFCRKDDPRAIMVYSRHWDSCPNPERFAEYRLRKERERYRNRRHIPRREPEKPQAIAATPTHEQGRLF